jgi:hypothetical protein
MLAQNASASSVKPRKALLHQNHVFQITPLVVPGKSASDQRCAQRVEKAGRNISDRKGVFARLVRRFGHALE